MEERYWTSRTSNLAYRLGQASENMAGEELDEMLWNTAAEALTARDPEMLCAVLRVGDLRSDAKADMRFGMATRAMERCYYDCACAAWEDGGRCWSSDERPHGVPSSRLATEIMIKACEALAAIESEKELGLCDIMRRVLYTTSPK